MKMSMNIYAKQGTKVIVLFDENGNILNGYDFDKEHAGEYLKQNQVYTIDKTEVGSFHTSVFLKEIPCVSFNSVHFEEYIEPERSFTIDDMRNAFGSGKHAGEMETLFNNTDQISIDQLTRVTRTFDVFMDNEYGIDITK